MLIDVNTYIGHWPFRQIRNNTPEGLVELMDKYGIDVSCVSSTNAIFYKDSQKGNEELSQQVKPFNNRFITFAIINPNYTGWKKDFFNSINELGMKGIELYPYYHQYKLDDPSAIELLTLAGENGIPVHLPCAIENIRQRHWMDTEKNLVIEEVVKAANLCPNTDFIVTNGPTNAYASILKTVNANRKGKIYYDFTRLDVFNGSFKALFDLVGADNIVFGSCAPLTYIDPQFVKLYYSQLNDTDKEKILSGNLKALFKL